MDYGVCQYIVENRKMEIWNKKRIKSTIYPKCLLYHKIANEIKNFNEGLTLLNNKINDYDNDFARTFYHRA